ncbi:MAG: endonuclease III [Anaerovoracaceae bacterium]|nr:endonuclease III [Anaerovoracaceae bacterium]
MASNRKKLTKKQALEVIDRLREEYPEAACALEHKDVWQLLVSVTLSAQTTDASVNRVTPALFEKYPDIDALAEADPADVAEIIKTIGMYKQKSRHIVSQAQMLRDEFGGEVPEDDALLRKLPGVGVKTANVVMADGFGHQRIAVDTHVFRVSNRIGLADSDNVTDTEAELKRILPHDRWTESHHEIIYHGRRCCHARKPECERCCLLELCLRKGLE